MKLLKTFLTKFNSSQYEFKQDEDLSFHTTIGLKVFQNLIIIKDLTFLAELLAFLTNEKISYFVLGAGSNVITTQSKKYIYIKLDFQINKDIFAEFKESYVVPANFPINQLTAQARKFGIEGWEVFTGVPASIGGAVVMNAGTSLGEIGKHIKNVWVLDLNGKEVKYQMDKNSFTYRKNTFLKPGDVITKVEISTGKQNKEIDEKIKLYLQMRWKTQPLNEKTCGCVFKNFNQTCLAGKFIDIIGLKGLTYKGLKVSHLHGNFIMNQGSATAEDFLYMTNLIRDLLLMNYGVTFELEVKVVE